MPKLVRLEISNFMGLAARTIEPGAVNLIRGSNGKGKTSLTEAIRFLLEGGTDASLLSAGAEKGIVRGTWENGIVATRTISAKGQAIDLKIPVDGATVSVSGLKEARSFLSNLVGEIAVDPMSLSYCPESKLAEYLSDLCSPVVTDAEIREAYGMPVPKTIKGGGLDRIAEVRKLVYDKRTGENRTAKDKRTHAAQLRETLPPETQEGADLPSLRTRKEGLEKRIAGSHATADVAYEDGKRAARRNAEGQIKEIEGNLERAIESLRVEAKVSTERIVEDERVILARLSDDRERAKREASREVSPEIEALTAEIGREEALAEERGRASKTLEILAAAIVDAEKAEAEAKALSDAIGRLDALRASKLANLPIPGLEIRDGEVLLNGLPWRRLNTAEQMKVGVKVGLLKAGKSGLLIVDHFEALDEAAQAQLIAAAMSEGLQVFGAERTEGPMVVESSEAA